MKNYLTHNWKIIDKNYIAYQAQVPGDITIDLYNAGVISDPYFDMNHKEIDWIVAADYTYQTSFDLSKEVYESDEILLGFDGIDTFAEIYLNGVHLGTTENMFLQYVYNIKDIALLENNKLEVKMLSTIDKMNEIDPEKYFGIFNNQRIFIRKAQCQFGWDWAPDMPGYGIYKPVWIEGVCKHRIDDISYHTYKDGNITLCVDLNYDTRPLLDYMGKPLETIPEELKNDKLRYSVCKIADTELTADNSEVFEQHVYGRNNFANFKMEKPRLWWPNGYGQQPMYAYKIELIRNAEILDVKEGTLAIREVELEQKPTSNTQLGFKLKVNGVSIFAKGSNWIPIDCFLGTTETEKYEHLLQLAKNSNMNMLRIWGGGIYEDDIFYETCDKLGIMVWQDMMFSCADIPEKYPDFVENVTREITYQIKRLRNHPSIVLWDGGNERVGTTCKQINHGAYFMEVILRGLITNLDKTRPFVSQSPYSITELANDASSGDVHSSSYGACLTQSVDLYRDFISSNLYSFVSENATMGPTTLESFKKMFTPENLWPMNDCWDAHLTQNPYSSLPMTFAGWEKHYAESFYGPCASIEDFVCKGMTTHAEVMRAELEYTRINKGTTWGFMNWMYSDCWPSATWSVVDYYCEPKQVYYQMKRSFNPILLTFAQDHQKDLVLCVVNDKLMDVSGQIEYGLKTLDGKIIWNDIISVNVPANEIFKQVIEQTISQPNTYLYAKALLNKRPYSTVFSYNMWRDCKFESDYEYKVDCEEKSLKVTIKANRFAKGITLLLPENNKYLYSDNYIDVEAGETRTVTISGAGESDIKQLVVTDFAKETY